MLAFACVAGSLLWAGSAGGEWRQWRGPLGTGAAPEADPPTTWSERRNIRFKAELPGLGHSTPVIAGKRIFLTAAVPHGEPLEPPSAAHDHVHDHGAHDNMDPTRKMRFVVIAFDRHSGKRLWTTTVRDAQPHEATHVTGSWASASPVTDGKRIYASFGSAGIYALDTKGKVLWEKDLGDMRTRHEHGEGSSPALWGKTLVINWDHQGASFLAALDTRNGKERWRVPRDEITSWSSPLIVEHGGRRQVIVAATGKVRGYDLEDGRLIWECGGLSRNVVATPLAAGGVVYVGNSYDWQALLAIRLDQAKGDITGKPAVIWSLDKHTPYVPSPVLTADGLCFIKHLSGVLSCVDPATGGVHWGPKRLPGIRQVFASPLAAGGRLYVADRNGVVSVLAQGKAFEVLATNRLDDAFSASPIAVGDTLYLRGEHHLYGIASTVAAEKR
ncbi:hypothetical protein ABI59_20045 [Acidobacteria bacterium Mor1]|nr:hypothetical protein ABI59_20045 [Acidobacteria bacterium Mor1]